MFTSTYWLLVPATSGTNDVVFQFLNSHGEGDDWQESVRCVENTQTILQSGWAIYDHGQLLKILRSARSKKITFVIFKCEEGKTRGEPWATEWEAGKAIRRRKKPLVGAAAIAKL